MQAKVVCLWCVTVLTCSASMAAEFKVLQPPTGVDVSSFTVRALSADGLTVVGDYVTGDRTEAFRWTAETGTVPLGDLPGGEHRSIAYGVSADGSVIVGTGSIGVPYRNIAFRWTASTGTLAFDGPTGTTEGVAFDVSDDGQVILGRFANTTWLWTELEGRVVIDGLDQGSGMRDLSPDGSTIIGQASNEGYLWNRKNGLVFMDTPAPFLSVLTHANAISADNSIIVGRRHTGRTGDAMRWTKDTGMVGLEPDIDTYRNIGSDRRFIRR